MKIVKTAQDEFRVILDDREAQILANCMKTALDEIMRTEFQTRTGSQPEEIESMVSALGQAPN